MTTRVVATAGHVDHGKSTLVKALTGTDPDRLPEEKRRGLTIELGFARLPLSDVDELHVIDVPGHARFVGTMLGGVGAIEACLLVVAATEGWMAQTEEHLRILELLGLEHGIVAITMSDRVDAAALARVETAVQSALAGSFLASVPRVLVDSVTGRGLPELRHELGRLVEAAARPEGPSRVRLWIDRAFSMPGAGTIVTGTLTGASVRVGDTVEVSTRRGSRVARVRGLESFGAAASSLGPGRRVAVNLSGIAHHHLHRGDVVIEPHRWHRTDVVDGSLRVLSTATKPVSQGGAYVIHLGSDEQPVRVQVLGARSIASGGDGLVRLRMARPVPLVPGDRFVLRDTGSSTTVGGGEVLDVAPVLRPSKARPDRSINRVVAERGWVDVDELQRLTGTHVEPDVGRWAVDRGALEQLRGGLHARVEQSLPQGLDLAALDERQRALVEADEQLVVRAGRVHPLDAPDAFEHHPYLDRLEAALFGPPSPADAGVSEADVRELVRRGLAIREDGIVFAPAAVSGAADAAAHLLARSPDGFTVADLRVRLGTSRRFTMALLARLDGSGVTRRRGDLRVAGPQLPTPPSRP